MELNIDDEWSEFLSIPNTGDIDLPPVIPDNDQNNLLECPKAGDIYISTKTNIAFLNESINLAEIFWKIPIIRYCEPSIGVVKKQMKFNSIKKEELDEIQKNLENYKCVEQNVITSIDNPSGRIKFKEHTESKHWCM